MDSIERMLKKQLKVNFEETNIKDLDINIVDNFNIDQDTWEEEGFQHYFVLEKQFEQGFKLYIDVPYNNFYVVNNEGVIISANINNLIDTNWSDRENSFIHENKKYLLYKGKIYSII
jgi:hypothetical protein